MTRAKAAQRAAHRLAFRLEAARRLVSETVPLVGDLGLPPAQSERHAGMLRDVEGILNELHDAFEQPRRRVATATAWA